MMTSPNTISDYDAEYAYYHARDVIKGRFLEAEPAIAKDVKYLIQYTVAFFENETVVTKENVSEFRWSQAGAEGFLAPAKLFKDKNSHDVREEAMPPCGHG